MKVDGRTTKGETGEKKEKRARQKWPLIQVLKPRAMEKITIGKRIRETSIFLRGDGAASVVSGDIFADGRSILLNPDGIVGDDFREGRGIDAKLSVGGEEVSDLSSTVGLSEVGKGRGPGTNVLRIIGVDGSPVGLEEVPDQFRSSVRVGSDGIQNSGMVLRADVGSRE